jgi:hypothetical protein
MTFQMMAGRFIAMLDATHSAVVKTQVFSKA